MKSSILLHRSGGTRASGGEAGPNCIVSGRSLGSISFPTWGQNEVEASQSGPANRSFPKSAMVSETTHHKNGQWDHLKGRHRRTRAMQQKIVILLNTKSALIVAL